MPDFRKYVRDHLPPLGLSGAREIEIIEELALDLEQHYHHAVASGLTDDQAWQEVANHARSWRELGGELRSAFGERPLKTPNAFARVAEQLTRDLRYAARQLSHSPAFTIVAVVMLALGVGANTAIFSLMNAILLRELPVRQPEQLFLFGKAQASGTTTFVPHRSVQVYSYPFFRDFRRVNQVFSDVAAIQSFLVETYARVAADANLESIRLELVSGNYFSTLGVAPVLGRVFTDADDRTPGAHPLAIASYSWWQDRMAQNPSIGGKTVTIGSKVYTIIGVGPPGFFGVTVGQSPDLWIPLTMEAQFSQNGLDKNLFQSLHLIGRLKPGVSLQRAQTATNFLFHRILRGYLGTQPPPNELHAIEQAWIDLTPAATGRSDLRTKFSSPLKILMAVVILVLLIACANVANLLIARAAARQREITIRMSLGADRGRLVRQLMAESALLGCIGALLGIAFAWSASRLLLAMISAGTELLPLRVTPDARVLGFTIAIAILTVFLFGTAPALRATAFDPAPTLKMGRGVISGSLRNRLARALVVGQVALSLVLLAGAGLFLRSLSNLEELNVGFDKQNVLRLRIGAHAAGYGLGARLTTLMQRIEQRVAALPGIEAASFAYSVFDGGGWSEDDGTVPGRSPSETAIRVDFNIVGPGYFDVMKTPIVLGRAPSARDSVASPKVAVINETMARTHFPGGSPLGRTFSVGDESALQNVQVIGVAKDARYMELEEKQMPATFFAHSQETAHFLRNLVVRYTGDAATVLPAIRDAIVGIDRNLPVSNVRTLAEMVDDFTLNRRLVAELSTFFGILAALLACIGIYGVLSYGIARRTNEFGIRMALGAMKWDVLWVVLRETLSLATAGVAIGLALALFCGRLVESLLFGTKPTNPQVMVASVATMIVVALIAGYLPARRAVRIDPSVALRDE